jgi:hypothetical protein
MMEGLQKFSLLVGVLQLGGVLVLLLGLVVTLSVQTLWGMYAYRRDKRAVQFLIEAQNKLKTLKEESHGNQKTDQ